MEKSLPPIPAKRYFTIGEVGELCDVKPHVLRYWEQEFTQLRPVKRRGNRRYYQHHEVLMIRRISDLLYSQGFTISGARNQLQELAQTQRDGRKSGLLMGAAFDETDGENDEPIDMSDRIEATVTAHPLAGFQNSEMSEAEWGSLRRELFEIRELLSI
jgi:DNA-binding transcriptional MerR regulator